MKSVPPFTDLMKPTLDALKALGGSGSVQEINDKMIEQLQISDEVANIPLGENRSGTLLQNRLSWARSFLKDAGFLENPRYGFWAIMPGKQDTNIDPLQIRKQYRDKFPRQQGKSKKVPETTEPDIEDESWHSELFSLLAEIHPSAFERLAQRLLRACGFVEVEVTGKSGDGGIDGIGIAKVNDLMSFHVIFQCKRQKNAITAGDIRSFRGAMAGRTDKGLFITTSNFTRDALKEATRDGVPPIDLIDGEQLMEKLKEFRLGIEVETVEKVSINKNWYQNI